MYEESIMLIREFGFPIVAFFLMYRMVDTTIKDNTNALHELRMVIKDMVRKK